MNTQKVKILLSAIQLSHVTQITDIDGLIDLQSHFVGEVKNDPNNQVLELEWQDDSRNVFVADFTEQALSDAVVNENRIEIEDLTGGTFELHLFNLVPNNVSERLSWDQNRVDKV